MCNAMVRGVTDEAHGRAFRQRLASLVPCGDRAEVKKTMRRAVVHPWCGVFLGVLALAPAVSTAAETPDPEGLSPIVVIGRAQDMIGAADSAAEGRVSAKQLVNRPLLRPAEVLETVPGLTVTQHSGDGKANQYFLRGFNLDHGSDFATSVMGMPVNMVSHAHGQGYMDMNFLIPELVRSLSYRKGVYAAEDGDFATTGSARIDYQRSMAAPMIDVSVGAHDYRRLMAAGSRDVGGENSGLKLLGAIELQTNDGPWDQPERLRRTNAVLRLSSGSLGNGYAFTVMGYQAQWIATEHVPERAITSGEISRYGALAPTDGGKTHRVSVSTEWARGNEDARTQASAYWIDYGLNLFSNPSGFINGLQGDQHEQADQRSILGGQAAQTWMLGSNWHDTQASIGMQLRHDRIGLLGLYNTEARERTNTVREDRVQQTALGLYAQAKTPWLSWLRSNVGLRLDEVSARVTPTGGAFNAGNGGHVKGHQVSPKLGLAFGPFNTLGQSEFYVNWGTGLRTNDMRGATSSTNPQDGNPVDQIPPPLVRAQGREVGVRALPLPGWNTSLTAWQMNLASELVFVGDDGVTEPRGASERMGVEWSNDWQVNRWLLIDGDVAWSRARFKEADNGGRYVPNAIPVSASLAAMADDQGSWFGGLRWRYIGSYALEETGEHKSRAFWTLNL
jgi:hypothetical protein